MRVPPHQSYCFLVRLQLFRGVNEFSFAFVVFILHYHRKAVILDVYFRIKQTITKKMTDKSNNKPSGYISPEVKVLNVSSRHVLCGSPQPGENEDIRYNEWDL